MKGNDAHRCHAQALRRRNVRTGSACVSPKWRGVRVLDMSTVPRAAGLQNAPLRIILQSSWPVCLLSSMK
eukprot:573209-Pyramimonas_sp.AAC.1